MLIGFIMSIFVVLSLTLNILLKDKNQKTESPDSEEEKVEVLNLYNNTDELVKKFKVLNPTTVNDGIEKNIQNRLLTGFENWNRGFKTWKEWGNILYIPESIYNVHGARLSLASYQAAMDVSLQQATILMGDFHNMLITDKYCAIHYDFTTNGKKSKVMEFVQFEETAEHGTYVKEGWGSVKDDSYYGLKHFQDNKEKGEEEAQTSRLQSLAVPKFIEKKNDYNSGYTDEQKQKLDIILEGFDSWNEGIDAYLSWVDEAYDKDAKSSGLNGVERTMRQYKEEMEQLFDEQTIKKIEFDKILIREDWAGIHYRYRIESGAESEKYVGDRMQFIKFQEKDGALKIVATWIQ
jgi:hypothetical protein